MTELDARRLHVHTRGNGPFLTFLHGFTQTSRSWGRVVEHFIETHTCQCVDLPGHGDSPDGRRSLPDIADDVAKSTTPGTLIGYSFGARVALHLALLRPEHVERLVLVSGTAGIIDDHERAQRKAADDELARRIEVVGIETFIDEWVALPLFAGLDSETNQRADRCRNTASGLADSLRYAGTGTQASLWHRLGDITCDVLLVAGADDPKFVDITRQMHQSMPRSEVHIIANSGHTVHLEQTAQFIRVVREWLETHQ